MTRTQWIATLLLTTIALGSTAQAGDAVLAIDPASIAVMPADAPAVEVQISDIRDKTALERQSLGASLGKIVVQPDEPQLVQAIVAAKASQFFLAHPERKAPPVIYCGIRSFTIETPSTLLYWDIKTSIDLVLRVGETDHDVKGFARTRTYVYPTRKLLEKTTREALEEVAANVEPALMALTTAPPSP